MDVQSWLAAVHRCAPPEPTHGPQPIADSHVQAPTLICSNQQTKKNYRRRMSGACVVSQSKDTVPGPYERRPRRKTRPDRYSIVPRDDCTGRNGQIKPRQSVKSNRNQRRQDARVTDLVQELGRRPKVCQARLTLQPKLITTSLFNNGRASRQVTSQAPAGIQAFVESSFLSAPNQKHLALIPTGICSRNHGARQQIEEQQISGFFAVQAAADEDPIVDQRAAFAEQPCRKDPSGDNTPFPLQGATGPDESGSCSTPSGQIRRLRSKSPPLNGGSELLTLHSSPKSRLASNEDRIRSHDDTDRLPSTTSSQLVNNELRAGNSLGTHDLNIKRSAQARSSGSVDTPVSKGAADLDTLHLLNSVQKAFFRHEFASDAFCHTVLNDESPPCTESKRTIKASVCCDPDASRYFIDEETIDQPSYDALLPIASDFVFQPLSQTVMNCDAHLSSRTILWRQGLAPSLERADAASENPLIGGLVDQLNWNESSDTCSSTTIADDLELAGLDKYGEETRLEQHTPDVTHRALRNHETDRRAASHALVAEVGPPLSSHSQQMTSLLDVEMMKFWKPNKLY